MADYHFVSTWEFATTPEQVWEFAGHPEKWMLFWPGLHDVRLLGGPGDGRVGSSYEFVFKSFLPFTLSLEGSVVESDPPNRMAIDTKGELEGRGTLEISAPRDGVTRSTFVWDTRTTIAWMNAAAPLLRGLFEWNHDFLMTKAGNGMSRMIGAPILRREDTGASLARALMPFVGIAGSIWLVRRARRLRARTPDG